MWLYVCLSVFASAIGVVVHRVEFSMHWIMEREEVTHGFFYMLTQVHINRNHHDTQISAVCVGNRQKMRLPS